MRLSPLSTPSATRAVLEKHGLYTKYGLGQNFLVNDDVVRKIVQLADVHEADHVLEVGPGIGTLTCALLQFAGHVTSIEMDHDLPAVLADTLAPWVDRFTLLEMDALDVSAQVDELFGGTLPVSSQEAGVASGDVTPPSSSKAGKLPGGTKQTPSAKTDELPVPALPNKMVSNLPYAVAATVVLDYFQSMPSMESATVMVQKEVADRMCAKPGSKTYGAYTVKLELFAKPAGRFSVAPGNFFPPPHVESTVLRLDRITPVDEEGVPLNDELRMRACMIADAAFANRRKTIANSFKTYFSGRGDEGASYLEALPSALEQAGVDARRRGETLSQAEFIRLAKLLAL